MGSLYTNTGKAGAVIGLIVTTLALTYVSTNATKIVEGGYDLCKKGIGCLKDAIAGNDNKEGHGYAAVLEKDPVSGKLRDTGRRVFYER